MRYGNAAGGAHYACHQRRVVEQASYSAGHVTVRRFTLPGPSIVRALLSTAYADIRGRQKASEAELVAVGAKILLIGGCEIPG
jgi:hypothetical protein